MKVSTLYPSKYAKAADLNGKAVTLTMRRVVIEEMGHGDKREKKPVLYFDKATKGVILNRTNAVTIANLYGDETDEWAGHRITIEPARVRAFGATHDVIRVRAEIPAQPKPAAVVETMVEESHLQDEEDYFDDGEIDGDALFERDEMAGQ